MPATRTKTTTNDDENDEQGEDADADADSDDSIKITNQAIQRQTNKELKQKQQPKQCLK